MLPGGNLYLRFLGLRQVENHRIENFLVPVKEVEAHIRLEVLDYVKIRPTDTSLLLGLAERCLECILSLFEVAFREIPIPAAAVEKKVLNPLLRSSEDDKARYDLLLHLGSLLVFMAVWFSFCESHGVR